MIKNQHNSPEDIYSLLKSQQAPDRLIKHHQLVVEAAEEIVSGLKKSFPNLNCNYQQVLIGSAIHDAGKIFFPNEISGSGNDHELAGEKHLLQLGIPLHIARFCRTHAHWQDANNTLEDLLVALADTLWKGCRNEELENDELENLVITKISSSVSEDFWDIFMIADFFK